MKELVHYLTSHPWLGIAVLAAVVVGAAVNPVRDGVMLAWGTLPGAAATPTLSDTQVYVYDSGDTGTHELGEGDGQADIILGADGGPAPAATPKTNSGASADLLGVLGTFDLDVLGMYCQAGKPYTNVQLSFQDYEDWFEADAIRGVFGDADCVVSEFDAEAYTALVTCTGLAGTSIYPILPFIEEQPLYIPIGECGSPKTTTEDSGAPRLREREPEPDCQDRRCK